jgi:N,N'-diacetyllegionaminate synthase
MHSQEPEYPVLIAEIGGNHEGDFDYAKRLVSLACETPADMIKLQVYTGDTLVSELEDPARNRHFKRFELNRDEHESLISMIHDAGKQYLCSVWDPAALDWIDPHVSMYKVGSGDLTAYPMLRKLAATSKPILLSTGLATLQEVKDAVNYLRNLNSFYEQSESVTLLQCTSMYPIADTDAHLSVMDLLKTTFPEIRVGYSDHTIGNRALQIAALRGAQVLEFHFTDRREGQTFRDHAVSLLPGEVSELHASIRSDLAFLGLAKKQPLPIEIENDHVTSFRRAVYPSRDIHAGELFGDHNLTVLRPNRGIDAREYDQLIGRTAKIDLNRHQALDWDMIL